MNIKELLNKLEAQNYGPKDSVIASTINHPINGIGKLLEYLDSNVKGVTNPYLSSVQQSEHATNIAGLAQTGALPFAPKSAGGVVGSVRLPGRNNGTVYHGSDILKNNDNIRLPFFVSKDRSFAKSMGQMSTDKPNIHSYKLSSENKLLDISDDISPLLKILNDVDYPYKLDGKYFNGQEEFPSVGFMQWPYPETVHDTLYIPRVRDELTKNGYNGIKYKDDSLDNLYDAIAFSDKPKLKPIRVSNAKEGSKIRLKSSANQ